MSSKQELDDVNMSSGCGQVESCVPIPVSSNGVEPGHGGVLDSAIQQEPLNDVYMSIESCPMKRGV